MALITGDVANYFSVDKHGWTGYGMESFDVGCGGGHVTLSMTSMVGPRGRIVAIDSDSEILALVRQDLTWKELPTQ